MFQNTFLFLVLSVDLNSMSIFKKMGVTLPLSLSLLLFIHVKSFLASYYKAVSQ